MFGGTTIQGSAAVVPISGPGQSAAGERPRPYRPFGVGPVAPSAASSQAGRRCTLTSPRCLRHRRHRYNSLCERASGRSAPQWTCYKYSALTLTHYPPNSVYFYVRRCRPHFFRSPSALSSWQRVLVPFSQIVDLLLDCFVLDNFLN